MEQEITPVSLGKLPVCAEHRARKFGKEQYCFATRQDGTQELSRVILISARAQGSTTK
jgi:hypothetical protein